MLGSVSSEFAVYAPVILRNVATALAPYLAVYAAIWGMELMLRFMHELIIDKIHHADEMGYEYDIDLFEYAELQEKVSAVEEVFGDVYSIFDIDMFKFADDEQDYNDDLYYMEHERFVRTWDDEDDFDYDQMVMYMDDSIFDD